MPQEKSPWPITIRIGYKWSNSKPESDSKSKSKPCSRDERYLLLKPIVQSVADEVKKRGETRQGKHPLYIQIGKMRARHGTELLPRFRRLCKQTDVLLFDITEENSNVMLELGMALAIKKATSGRVFILKKGKYDAAEIPSDLRGYLITFFEINNPAEDAKDGKKELKLSEPCAFRAALRTAIIDLARERKMWADRGVIDEEDLERSSS